MYRSFFKRGIDFVVALVALVVLSLVLLVVTVWLHFANKGAGAFFLQERPGLHGKIFKIVKFKSMTDERDADGNLLPNEARLTPIGRMLNFEMPWDGIFLFDRLVRWNTLGGPLR